MYEVVGRRAPDHVLRKGLRVTEVALDDLDPRVAPPAALVQFPRLADEAPDRVAGGEERRHESPADVPGCTGDEDAWAFGHPTSIRRQGPARVECGAN